MARDVLGNMSKRSFAFRALAEELLHTRRANRELARELTSARTGGTALTNFTAYMAALERLGPKELADLLTTRLSATFAPDTEENCLCLAAAYRLAAPKPTRVARVQK